MYLTTPLASVVPASVVVMALPSLVTSTGMPLPIGCAVAPVPAGVTSTVTVKVTVCGPPLTVAGFDWTATFVWPGVTVTVMGVDAAV